MADFLTLDVSDFTKFAAELRSLPDLMRQKLLRGAADEVMTALRDRAVAEAPMETEPGPSAPPPGNLKRAIYRMRVPEECNDRYEVWKVGVRVGKGSWKRKRNQGRETNSVGAFYAYFVEHGHWTRTPKSAMMGLGTRDQKRKRYQDSGKARWVPANPFFARAFEAIKPTISSRMQAYVDRNIRESLRTFKYVKLIRG